MADNKTAIAAVRTPSGVLSFPNLFVARSPSPGADPRFSINLVFDAAAQKTPEFKALKAAIWQAGLDFHGPGMFKTPGVFPKGFRDPVRDASEKDYAGYDEGSVFISAWTKAKPGVVDGQRSEITDPSGIFAGQRARATVKPFGYNNSGNKGVGLMLNNVQITKVNADRLDGRKAAKDDFDEVEDASSDEDDMPF